MLEPARLIRSINPLLAGLMFLAGAACKQEAPTDFRAVATSINLKEPDKNLITARTKVYFEDREDLVLANMAKAEPGPQLIIFGAAHDWKNNISAWNKTNDNKFSLTVISSPAVIQHEEEFSARTAGAKMDEAAALLSNNDYKAAQGLAELILQAR